MAEEQHPPENNNQPPEEGAKAVPPKKSGSNKTLMIVLIVVLVLFLLPGLLIGAGVFWLSRGNNVDKLAENLIESSTGAEVDFNSNDGSFTIENEDGSFAMATGESLPDGFPESLALYEPQTITASWSQNDTDNGTSSWFVSANTDASAGDVASFVTEAYQTGWESVSSSTFNDTRSYTYQNDSYDVSITLSPSDEAVTTINYIVSTK